MGTRTAAELDGADGSKVSQVEGRVFCFALGNHPTHHQGESAAVLALVCEEAHHSLLMEPLDAVVDRPLGCAGLLSPFGR